ncbi:NIL domain-containing protein [Thermodesulfobacteriota bacterium]
MKKTVVLNFTSTTWDQPIICNLSKEYNLVFNILKANITPQQEGILILELIGSEEDFNKGIKYLESFSIRISPLEKDVTRNDDICLQCGVCTSMCPTKALDINRETMEITFDVNKCIGCEACVKICPPRAMQVIF